MSGVPFSSLRVVGTWQGGGSPGADCAPGARLSRPCPVRLMRLGEEIQHSPRCLPPINPPHPPQLSETCGRKSSATSASPSRTRRNQPRSTRRPTARRCCCLRPGRCCGGSSRRTTGCAATRESEKSMRYTLRARASRGNLAELSEALALSLQLRLSGRFWRSFWGMTGSSDGRTGARTQRTDTAHT